MSDQKVLQKKDGTSVSCTYIKSRKGLHITLTVDHTLSGTISTNKHTIFLDEDETQAFFKTFSPIIKLREEGKK